MSYSPSRSNKRKHSSKDEGEWKKISLEGEWEKISLKGEGEWRKISFDPKKPDFNEKEKRSIHHDTMIPLQEILKSKMSNPAVKSNVSPVLKAKLPPPVLISHVPIPLLQSNLPTPVLKFNVPTPVLKFNVPTPVIKSNASTPIFKSSLSDPVIKSNMSTPALESNVLKPKSNVSNSAAIRDFLEREKLDQQAISELSSCPVFYSNISSCMPSKNEVIKPVEFPDCVLYFPEPSDAPLMRHNNLESNHIYVSGIPLSVSRDTVKQIFEPCGNICSIKFNGRDGCHLQFDSRESACKAVKLAGCKLRPNKAKVNSFKTKKLFIYFAKPDEESNVRSSSTSPRERDTEGKVSHFSHKRGRQLSRLFKDENRFIKGIPDLMYWLKKGECTKETNNNFLSMMKNLCETQVRRFSREFEVLKANYDETGKPLQQVMERISIQLDDICKVFNIAKTKSVWFSFSKWQKKNLDLCRLITLEVRKIHYQELIEKRREVEMEMSDQEDDSDEGNTSKKDLNFSFQTNNLESSVNSSSQDQMVVKKKQLLSEDTFLESVDPNSNKMATSKKECDLEKSSKDCHADAVKKDLGLNFQTDSLETLVESSCQLQCVEETITSLNTSFLKDKIIESTVSSTVQNKNITDSKNCDFEEINLHNNNIAEADKEDFGFNFQANNIDISVNSSSQLQFDDEEVMLYQEDNLVESTVSSIVSSNRIIHPEESDSNGISSSENYFNSNKIDIVPFYQSKDVEIPLIGYISPNETDTSLVNPNKASYSGSQNCDNMNVSQSDLRLMILITSFLLICPLGANLESVCQYLNNTQPLVETQTVVNVLKKFPNLFQENSLKTNESCSTNWKFIGLNTK